jgi:hypothetical protein
LQRVEEIRRNISKFLKTLLEDPNTELPFTLEKSKLIGSSGKIDGLVCYYHSGMFVMVHVWCCPALMAPVAVPFMAISVQSPAKEDIMPGG